MKYALLLSAALLMAFGQARPASAQSPLDLVKQSVEAMGGADALRAIKSQVAKGEAKHWEPGQSYSVTGESLFIGDSQFTTTADFTTGLNRTDWDRDMKDPGLGRVKYSEIRSQTYGAVIDDKGEARPMSAVRLAASVREASRGAPSLLLQLVRALDTPQNLAAIEDQRLGNQTYPAVVWTDRPPYNFKYIILFDRTTKLPVAVRSRARHGPPDTLTPLRS
jgi:hypothetical protein